MAVQFHKHLVNLSHVLISTLAIYVALQNSYTLRVGRDSEQPLL